MIRIPAKVESDETPRYFHDTDAGMDLMANLGYRESGAPEELVIPAWSQETIGTGVRMALPRGYEGQVRSRSGMAAKYGVCVLNSPGTIDPGYTGEIKVVLATRERAHRIAHGDRIAQIVIAPVEHADLVLTDDLEATKRGDNGIGSTGT